MWTNNNYIKYNEYYPLAMHDISSNEKYSNNGQLYIKPLLRTRSADNQYHNSIIYFPNFIIFA